MTRLLLHCAATLLLTAFAATQDAVTAYTNANILPGGKPAMSDATMVISGGKILAIGGADLQVPEGAKVIDCKGRTITPGLIDASFQSGDNQQDLNEQSEEVTPHLRVLDLSWTTAKCSTALRTGSGTAPAGGVGCTSWAGTSVAPACSSRWP